MFRATFNSFNARKKSVCMNATLCADKCSPGSGVSFSYSCSCDSISLAFMALPNHNKGAVICCLLESLLHAYAFDAFALWLHSLCLLLCACSVLAFVCHSACAYFTYKKKKIFFSRFFIFAFVVLLCL